ncbi:hypothetical protein E4631_09640 [Hymenobacter sp. UV11]|uniref:hypothetical protein n=1 Tax=Hymenobacter sp. UV11 TaxID=1849735 RepID=UPI00105DA593|nr:hypothetical protein [Hymenobacter sp. UV11]TDN39684.1 hypothetical protein A8B98_17045 [Hymenobacter sp. UV11]TFZ67197.1 hypothetical protein E4631_09640 [Hymenobacter sp. UV11]
MAQLYLLKGMLLAGSLLLAAASDAQTPPAAADSVPRPPQVIYKLGLRLTHLRYAHDSQAWQFLLPLSLGVEYRVAPRLSLYTQFEADMLTSYTNGRRRGAQNGSLSAASAALGVRYYYGHVGHATPVFGRYLALEGSTDWEQLSNARFVSVSGSVRGRGRTTPSVLTPGIYALWGVQHRLRGHVLYDINAGAGLLAPAYYNYERPVGASHWNVGGQATIRLYFAL